MLAARQGRTKLPPEETSSTGMNASLALPVAAILVLAIGIFLMIGGFFLTLDLPRRKQRRRSDAT